MTSEYFNLILCFTELSSLNPATLRIISAELLKPYVHIKQSQEQKVKWNMKSRTSVSETSRESFMSISEERAQLIEKKVFTKYIFEYKLFIIHITIFSLSPNAHQTPLVFVLAWRKKELQHYTEGKQTTQLCFWNCSSNPKLRLSRGPDLYPLNLALQSDYSATLL